LSWHGLQQFSARLFRAVLDRLGEDCIVIGSRSPVPVKGMEAVLRRPIRWIDATRPVTWREVGLDVPDVFMQSGWAYPAFNALGREVKAAGGHVVGLTDVNWRGD